MQHNNYCMQGYVTKKNNMCSKVMYNAYDQTNLILYYAFIFLTIAYTIEPYVFIDGLKFPAIMIMVFFFFSKQWRILQLSALFVLILMFFKREMLYSHQISCNKLLWVFNLNPLLKWLFCSLITNHLEFVLKIL